MVMLVSRESIPTGDSGTKITVGKMVELIRWGAWQPTVRQHALRVMGNVDGRDGYRQALALRDWLVEKFLFVRDPMDVELLHSPVYLLTHPGEDGKYRADCDDAATLGASLAQAVGLQARLVVVGFLSPNAPFRHVWAEVAAPSGPDSGKWVELDVTRTAQKIPTDKIARTWIVPVVPPNTNTTLKLLLGVVLLCIMTSGSISSKS